MFKPKLPAPGNHGSNIWVYSSVLMGLIVSGCASTGPNAVYLYDDSSDMARMVNDMTIWKDADVSSQSGPPSDSARYAKIACIMKPKSDGTILSVLGDAVEVQARLGCRGFIHKRFVHKS